MNMHIHKGLGHLLAASALLLAAMPMCAQAVDGVVLITQARALAGGITAGDTPGFPITISEPGSYRLASDLSVNNGNLDAINVTVDHVTIDLNGFSISGTGAGSGSGAGISSDQTINPGGSDIVVKNGTIRDMGSDGIRIDSSCQVDRVNVLGNGGDGMFLTTGAMVSNSGANGNGRNGIHILIGKVSSSNATSNQQNGILVGYGSSLVIDNVVERNTGFGLNVLSLGGGLGTGVTGYARNTFASNNGGDDNAQVNGLASELGANICGADTVCP